MYSSLTSRYSLQPSFLLSYYLPLAVGLGSAVFGIYLIVGRKPIFANHNASLVTKEPSAKEKLEGFA